MKTGFTFKELFKDIDLVELQFMNKCFKHYYEVCKEKMLPKRTVSGDKWPSNQWHDQLKCVACALLFGHRRIKKEKLGYWEERKEMDDLIDLQIDYAAVKWGFGVAFYSGDWEEFAESIGVDPFAEGNEEEFAVYKEMLDVVLEFNHLTNENTLRLGNLLKIAAIKSGTDISTGKKEIVDDVFNQNQD